MARAVIFDFDGTMVRSHAEVYEVLKELSVEYGFPLPPAEELKLLSTLEIIKALGIRPWQVPRFTVLARSKLKARTKHISFEPGVLEVISQLRQDPDLKIAIVSSNSAENVRPLLARENAVLLFDRILCGSSTLGKHRPILKTIRALGVNPTSTIYVGDETRDIDAARRIDVRVAAVSWGFHARSTLEAYEPEFIVDTMEDLRRICLSGF